LFLGIVTAASISAITILAGISNGGIEGDSTYDIKNKNTVLNII
jgi:hypothetical protein